jgi:hypothetical protein
MKLRFSALVLLAAIFGCGGKLQRAFVYQDLQCAAPLPDGGAGQCHEVGDGATYLECASDGDCPGATPFCRTLGLFKGGDFNCNATVRICRPAAHDDCVR